MSAKHRTTSRPASGDGHLSDIESIRRRARSQLDEGAITPSYGADPDAVLKMLNEALATEIVCVLRYRRHYFTANGAVAEAVRSEFLVHSQQEQEHADKIAERIVQLGGEPDFDPAGLVGRSHAEYREGHSLEEMIREDLVAERIAIESYREMIDYLRDKDHTTRRLVEEILAVEEEHAGDLTGLLAGLGKRSSHGADHYASDVKTPDSNGRTA
jgi:bacterioferritin